MRFPFRLGSAALVCALVAALVAPPPAAAETALISGAASDAPLELRGYVKLEKVTTDAAGERRVNRVDPVTVVPGDKLIFGTRFANRGSAPIEQFVVSNAVPAAVSVTGEIDPGVQVSVDGGTAWGKLADLEIADAAGARRAALPADITNVRWVLPSIAPGETGVLEFPVTVR